MNKIKKIKFYNIHSLVELENEALASVSMSKVTSERD